ncbi:MAG TPA: hypothetical protein PK605_13560 [Ignavibacteria bacterium]|nr:hypothetical protein [Ignavibacteria bacterium]HAX47728.1 hypothetical protein [Bacteroidota bacterium]HRE09666.1 hypothetical protein [Ignavibacteria bacterium]HRF64315.1 hypothetical protein [Ignavibacteria bacterium]HRJ05423.1 hypothetical protein [Ignavibacteria bacterium]
MKYLITTAIILSSLFLFNSRSFSQSATTMQDIMETVSAKVIELEDQRNQEIVNMTFDLLVNTGKKTLWRYLDPAFDYDVMVLGDRRIENIKVTVYKKNAGTNEWEFVDEYSDSRPVIRIDPQDFEQYEFTVTVDKFKTGSTTGHFALLLYHQNPERGK